MTVSPAAALISGLIVVQLTGPAPAPSVEGVVAAAGRYADGAISMPSASISPSARHPRS